MMSNQDLIELLGGLETVNVDIRELVEPIARQRKVTVDELLQDVFCYCNSLCGAHPAQSAEQFHEFKCRKQTCRYFKKRLSYPVGKACSKDICNRGKPGK